MTLGTLRQKAEWLVIVGIALAIGAYLLKMAYMHVLPGTLLGLLVLLASYGYLRSFRGVRVPVVLFILLLGAAEVDLVGNYFHMYGRPFGPVQYDEFSHMATSALTAPIFVWVLREAMQRLGYRLPLSLIAILAVSLSFSGAAIYEIIELWDELYFGGKRIWSPHDTPNDLQWDLVGKIVGAAITVLVLSQVRPQAKTVMPDDGDSKRPSP